MNDTASPASSRGGQILFLVGFVTLGAELWLGRSVSLVVGSDGTGLALTLGAFLLGSAAGSFTAGRGHGGVATWSFAAALLFPLSAVSVHFLPAVVSGGSGGEFVARALGAFLVALPAFTFGALPVVWFGEGSPTEAETHQRVGRWIGALDLGSALGALALPLLLLPLLGSLFTGLALVVVLAIAAFSSRAGTPRRVASRAVAEPAERHNTRGRRGRIAIAAGVGAVTLALQLTSTRLLGEILGTSLAVLGVATAATLLGGAIAARAAPRAVERYGAQAVILAAGVAWLVAQGGSAWAIAELPGVLIGVLGALGGDAGNAPTIVKLLVVLLIVLPPSLAAGFVLPSLLAGWCDDAQSLRRDAGPIDAAWMIGGACGAWGIGLFVLSRWGSGAALGVAGGVTALAVAVGWARTTLGHRSLRVAVLGGGVLSVALFTGAILRWDPAFLGAGVFHWHRGDVTSGEALAGWRAREITYVGEGVLAKVSIEVAPAQNTSYLRVGGRIEGSVPIDPSLPSFADLPTEIMLGILPVIEGSGTGELLVIGLGGGTTVTTAAESWDGPVTVLELEPEVAKALRSPAGKGAFPREHACLFPETGSGPTLIFEDARSSLARNEKLWDAIICQPSEPWLPWSAPLFTPDFYRLVRRRLAPEGVAVHWLQLYEIAPAEFAAIVQGFLGAFPDARCYHPPGTGEVILVGGGTPDPAHRAAQSRRPAVIEAWARLGGVEFPPILAGAKTLSRWSEIEAGGRSGNLRARLEFRLPLLGDRGDDRSGMILQSLAEAARRGS